MKRWVLTLIAMLLPVMGRAAEVDPDKWETKSFVVSQRLLSDLHRREARDNDHSSLEALDWHVSKPGGGASDDEWIAFLRKQTATLKRLFGGEGAEFPKGTVLAYDAKNSMLVMRSTAAKMGWGECAERATEKEAKHILSFQADVMEADAREVQEIVEESAGRPQHHVDWDRVMKLREQGRAEILKSVRLEVKSGGSASAEGNQWVDVVTKAVVDELDRTEIIKEQRNGGLKLELRPVLAPGSSRVHLDYTFEYDFAPPVWRSESLEVKPGGTKLELPVIDRRNVSLSTSMMILDGETKLVGVWSPTEKPDRMQIAFLRCDVAPQLPIKPNRELQQVLDRYADQIEKAERAVAPPVDMEVREFIANREFFDRLEVINEKSDAPVDPFEGGGKERWVMTTPREMLMFAGVTFPSGAVAMYLPGTNKLWVRNTADNLGAVEAYIESIRYTPPSALNTSIRVVQAKGDLIREWMKTAQDGGDHSELWGEVRKRLKDGSVVAVDAVRLEGRSGLEIRYHAGLTMGDFAPLQFGDGVADGNTSPQGQRLLFTKLGTRPAGMSLELDPVVGADGYTIDADVRFKYHFAPPHLGTPEMGGVRKEFTAFSTAVALTTISGQDRLLGVWKPESVAGMEGDVWQAAFLRMDFIWYESEF